MQLSVSIHFIYYFSLSFTTNKSTQIKMSAEFSSMSEMSESSGAASEAITSKGFHVYGREGIPLIISTRTAKPCLLNVRNPLNQKNN